jgi:hypothetical protein
MVKSTLAASSVVTKAALAMRQLNITRAAPSTLSPGTPVPGGPASPVHPIPAFSAKLTQAASAVTRTVLHSQVMAHRQVSAFSSTAVPPRQISAFAHDVPIASAAEIRVPTKPIVIVTMPTPAPSSVKSKRPVLNRPVSAFDESELTAMSSAVAATSVRPA